MSFLKTWVVEYGLVSALVEITIPDEIAHLPIDEFRHVRNSYGEVREAFQEITARAPKHRLAKIGGVIEFQEETESVAQQFEQRLKEHRDSQYMRRFKLAPMYVGAILAIASGFVEKPASPLLRAGGVALTLLANHLKVPA